MNIHMALRTKPTPTQTERAVRLWIDGVEIQNLVAIAQEPYYGKNTISFVVDTFQCKVTEEILEDVEKARGPSEL